MLLSRFSWGVLSVCIVALLFGCNNSGSIPASGSSEAPQNSHVHANATPPCSKSAGRPKYVSITDPNPSDGLCFFGSGGGGPGSGGYGDAYNVIPSNKDIHVLKSLTMKFIGPAKRDRPSKDFVRYLLKGTVNGFADNSGPSGGPAAGWLFGPGPTPPPPADPQANTYKARSSAGVTCKAGRSWVWGVFRGKTSQMYYGTVLVYCPR
jgi:hypothetical protein